MVRQGARCYAKDVVLDCIQNVTPRSELKVWLALDAALYMVPGCIVAFLSCYGVVVGDQNKPSHEFHLTVLSGCGAVVRFSSDALAFAIDE